VSDCGYIVLAHHKPRQALRLVDRLAPAPVFLHVDRGAEATVGRFLAAGAVTRDHVTLLPRSRSAWASWGQVEPALAGFRGAYAQGLSHAVVLSGQDYPLVSPAEIDAFCRRHEGTSFMPYWPLPSDLWGRNGGMERVRHWHQPIRRRRFRLPVRRRLPVGLAPYGGASWFMLARDAMGELMRFLGDRPEVARFYRRAWTPDEMFIHTALLNSPARDAIANENLWFVRWTPNSKHPRVLTAEDAPALVKAAGQPSDTGGDARAKLFARKFDADVDAGVLDLLDREAVPA
jgi:Core-2/I-Branching enzyme